LSGGAKGLIPGDHSYNLLDVMIENENYIYALFTYFDFKKLPF
jgi:hypothetical protein